MPSKNDQPRGASTQEDDRSLAEIVTIVRERGWWIALATAGGVLLAAVATAVMPPVYRADLSLIAGGQDEPSKARPDSTRILGTWVYVLGDAAIRDQAAARLAARHDSENLRSVRISVSPIVGLRSSCNPS